ncbi:MAG: zinc-binding dehydrogenase [Planctomycetota bacterium]
MDLQQPLLHSRASPGGLDTKTTRNPSRHLRSLKPGGSYATVGGLSGKLFRTLLFSLVCKRLTGKHVKVLGLDPNRGLEDLDAVMENRKLELLIDGPYSLEETPSAIQRLGDGRHTGKVVVRVGEEGAAAPIRSPEPRATV